MTGEKEEAAGRPAVDGPAYRYWAFLSYSHADSKQADRLHHFLERFRVPEGLVGNVHPLGVIPKHVKPIFRDRNELAAASSLSREIDEALVASRYLIVLCSPAAAKSHWVDEEVRRFKQLHGEEQVLAAIVAGEPFSDEEECFPPALRFRVGKNGKLTKDKVEPIAADLREDRDGPRIGALKIAAGMLEVGLDDLVQRDQQRRNRRARWIVAASVAGMIFTTGLSVVAINARNTAQEERRAAESLVGFMLGDLKDELEPIGRLDALDQVGARALAYYERQNQKELTDVQLAQRSKALTLLGQIATARGDSSAAEARYREAMRGTAELVERMPDDPRRLFDHAQNVFWMGELARQRGEIEGAERAYRQYLSLADRMVASEPGNPKWQMEQLYARENIGVVLYTKRRFAEAARELETVLPQLQRLVATYPERTDYQIELSTNLAWLADARRDHGQLDQAIAARNLQISVIHAGLEHGSSNVQLQQLLLPANQALGILLATRGRTRDAIAQFEVGLREAAKLRAIEPENATWQGGGAALRLAYASALMALDRVNRAEGEAKIACAEIAALRQRDPTNSGLRGQETICLSISAHTASLRGDTALARQLARGALNSAQTEQSGDPFRDRYSVAAAYRRLGDVERRGGEMAMAREHWGKALAVLPENIAERPRESFERAALLERTGQRPAATLLITELRKAGYRSADGI